MHLKYCLRHVIICPQMTLGKRTIWPKSPRTFSGHVLVMSYVLFYVLKFFRARSGHFQLRRSRRHLLGTAGVPIKWANTRIKLYKPSTSNTLSTQLIKKIIPQNGDKESCLYKITHHSLNLSGIQMQHKTNDQNMTKIEIKNVMTKTRGRTRITIIEVKWQQTYPSRIMISNNFYKIAEIACFWQSNSTSVATTRM